MVKLVPVKHIQRRSYTIKIENNKQLKTFLTQIGPTVPLTPDPSVRAEGGGRGWRPIETASLGMFSAQNQLFSHLLRTYPPRTHSSYFFNESSCSPASCLENQHPTVQYSFLCPENSRRRRSESLPIHGDPDRHIGARVGRRSPNVPS